MGYYGNDGFIFAWDLGAIFYAYQIEWLEGLF